VPDKKVAYRGPSNLNAQVDPPELQPRGAYKQHPPEVDSAPEPITRSDVMTPC
jgi:hypothetical protein